MHVDTRSYPATHDQVVAAMISTFTQDSLFQSMILSSVDFAAGEYFYRIQVGNSTSVKKMILVE
ncbi:MAG TPA: hypothetical protein ENK14_11625 [Caldithrix sp.]|nr:hypothetical protein [Caldithrix sp.]